VFCVDKDIDDITGELEQCSRDEPSHG
jgi:hypothetical protein